MSTTAAGRVVIVGASLAGATAAFTLRERGYDGDIVLVGPRPRCRTSARR